MELSRQYEAPMHAAFVDFSKAFDLVNHRVLWAALRARGLDPKLVDLVQDLYADSNASRDSRHQVQTISPLIRGKARLPAVPHLLLCLHELHDATSKP